jgi:adenylate cyclase
LSAPAPPDPLARLVRLGRPTLDPIEVCRKAGVDREVADQLWRALGFPDVPDGVLAYTDEDARALRLAAQGLDELDEAERERGLQLILEEARMVSAHLTALAEAELDALTAEASLGLRREVLADAAERGLQDSDLGWLIFYVLRRRLNAVLQYRIASEDHAEVRVLELAVAFVDLTGFTRWSERAEPGEIDEMLTRFEARAFDAVAEANGRVVKLIGDEVMFICPSAGEAARACLEILGLRDPALPTPRAGLAYGPMLRRSGDYFGRTVNLAGRINRVAEPGSLVVDEPTRRLVEDAGGFEVSPFGEQDLKGLGEVSLWRVRHSGGGDVR